MTSDDLGSISRALQEGGDDNRQRVVARSAELFARLWASMAKNMLPAERQRSANYEDAVQETLFELDRMLRRPDHPLRSRDDVRRLGARILACNARDVLRDNNKHEGASVVGGGGRPDNEDAEETVGGAGEVACPRTPSPQASAEAAEIDERLKALEGAVSVALSECSEQDRKIVENWLDWCPYRTIAETCKVTVRDVRNTTFDFKSGSRLAAAIEELRGWLLDAETEESGVAHRVHMPARAGRLLCDMRAEA